MFEQELRAQLGADAQRIAALALAEDGPSDITSLVCIASGTEAAAALEFRTAGVLAGTTYADAVAQACGLETITWYLPPGTAIPAGSTVGLIRGDLRLLLRAERPLLNLLQRAVGIATSTRSYVERVSGTPARILHTRKTAPGLRLLDVSSVLAGGGYPHRLDLSQVVMIKDNHWRALEQSGQSVAEALNKARAQGISDCYVEVESLRQVESALAAGASRLLIDNQSPETVRTWGDYARGRFPGIEIEATGGITLENVRAFAVAGADCISIGALTHSVKAADVSLEVRRE
ncbi:MAG: carboxylating nicotinate-nucleotide diphosphorylase [Gemmatimonadales bacterium]